MQKFILLALLVCAPVATATSFAQPAPAANVVSDDTGASDTEDASYRRYSPTPVPTSQ